MDKEYIKYAKYGGTSIAIYNPHISKWEVKLSFRNRVDRNAFYDRLPKECQSQITITNNNNKSI